MIFSGTENFDLIVSLVALLLGALTCVSGYKARRILFPAWALFLLADGVVLLAKSQKIGAVVLFAGILLLASGLLKRNRDGFVFNGLMASVAACVLIGSVLTGEVLVVAGIVLVCTGVGIAAGTLSHSGNKFVHVVITAIAGAGAVLKAACMAFEFGGVQANNVVFALWIPVAVIAFVVQYATTQGVKVNMPNIDFAEDGGRAPRVKSTMGEKSEIPYSELGDFCMKCGSLLPKGAKNCPKCGFKCGKR